MAYDGTLKFDSSVDTKGFQAGSGKMSNLITTSFLAIGAAAATALVSIGKVGIGYNARMEEYTTNFTTMLGSQEAAIEKVEVLKNMAAKTPFGMEDLANGTQTLLAFGVESDRTTEILRQIGDVSLGNKGKFESLTLAFAQVSSTGKLMGQDLNQMINAGFNPLQEISRTTGKSMSDLKEEMGDGAITAGMVAEAFRTATAEEGKFNEGMEAASKTLSGQWSTLMDDAAAAAGAMFQPFNDVLASQVLPNVIALVADLAGNMSSPEMTSAMSNVAEGFGTLVEKGVELVVTILPSLVAILGLVSDAFKFVVDNSGVLLPILVGIGAAVVAWKIGAVIMGIVKIFQAATAVVQLYAAGAKMATIASIHLGTGTTVLGTIMALLTGKIGLVTVAQQLWNAAMKNNYIGVILAAIALLAGAVIGIIAIFSRSNAVYEAEKETIKDLRNAHKEYADQLKSNAAAAAAIREEKNTEMKLNRGTAKSLHELIIANDEYGSQNTAISAAVEKLNASMGALGLAYDSSTGQLNMSNEELQTYMNNLEAVTGHQMKQEEYNRLLGEQVTLQARLDAAMKQPYVWAKMLNERIIDQTKYNDLVKQNEEYINDLRISLYPLNDALAEAKVAAETSYNAQAEAAVSAQQIRNNEMDTVKAYADLWGVTADEVIDRASQMAGGLEELAAQQAKLYTTSGQDVGMIAEIYKQSTDSIQAYLDETGNTLDDYVKWAQDNLTEEGLSVEQLADKWGVSTESIRRDMRMTGQSVQEWEEAQQEALDTAREFAAQAGASYDEIATEAAKAGMSINDFVAYQQDALTSSGLDIQQVADYWGATIGDIQRYMDTYRVSLDQANDDMAAMRTKSGKSLDEFAASFGTTTEVVRSAAAAMGVSWQDYGDDQEAQLKKAEEKAKDYAKTYKMTVAEVKAGLAAMGGDTEAWVARTEQSMRAASVAEQAYVAQIKAGNVEISASYVTNLEMRRQSGDELNAIEQAYLDQWHAMNQAAVEAYKAKQQEIVDASKAKAGQIKLSDQQSAKEILAIQSANNAATAQYVQNYNTIWAQIPASQRKYLSELGVDSARFLQEMVNKWDKGGKEQWAKYAANIEECTTNTSRLAGESAARIGEAFISGTETKSPEVQQAGTDLADAAGVGMEESTAPSESSQAIADAVIEELTNADFSGITAAIATAITGGTSAVVTAATAMAGSVLLETDRLKTNAVTKMGAMMIGINTTILSRAATVKGSVTSMADGVLTSLNGMRAKGESMATQMMTNVNSAIIIRTAPITSSATALVNGIVNALWPMVAGGVNIANRMMDGMLAAMTSKEQDLYAKAQEIASNIAAKMATALDVRSPSRVMIKLFTNVMMGIYNGMDGMSGMLYREAERIADGLAARLTVSPHVFSKLYDEMRAITTATPLGGAALVLAEASESARGVVNYSTSLTQNITTPKPLSPSEMTREGQDLLRRSRWQLP